MKNILIIIILFSINSIYSQNAKHACSNLKMHSFNKQTQNRSALAGVEDYDVKFLKLRLNVTNLNRYIEGTCTQKVKIINATNSFSFELAEELTISAAKIDGNSTTFTHIADDVIINSAYTHQIDDLVDVEITYSGTPPNGSAFAGGTGLFNDFSPTWGTQVTWTLSEPYEAYTWWPCKQDLNDKIDSTELIYITNDSLKVGSNGLLVSETQVGANQIEYVWKSNYPIDYYLVSFAVAPYNDYSYKVLVPGATDSLLVQNYIYRDPNYLPSYETNILVTGDMIIEFSDKYGLYPFINEKYGHCIAPLGGGMEHQTMTTQGWFANWLTAHELGHQWWGDNVTCSTWGDIWLNEGFASYSEYLYYQKFENQASADSDMEGRHNNIMSDPGGSVFVQDITVSGNIFDSRLVYDKGAAVVHMIRNSINNDTEFFEVLKAYQTTFSGKTASTSDLNSIIFDVTGLDFTDFFDAWIFEEGYPIYYGKYNTKNDTIFISISQNSSINSTVYPAGLDLQLFFNDGTDTIVRAENTNQTDEFYYLIDKQISTIVVDPSNWILNLVDSFAYDQSYSFTPEIDVSSINNLANSKFIIVENPFNNFLKVHFKGTDINNVVITNSIGEIIYTNSSIENHFSTNTSVWSKGVYFISIEEKGIVYSKKLLKQ